MKIDGKAIAQEILDDLQKRVEKLKQKGIIPHLAIILIGDDPASSTYVRQKELKAEYIGAKSTVHRLPTTVSQSELLALTKKLNEDKNIHGIIVQQPLPNHIDTSLIVQTIEPKKDVDGFHPQTKFPMPLAAAVLKILDVTLSQWLKSQNIVVIGKGETGGRPVIEALRKRGANVTVIDSKTPNPKQLTQNANIIISAVGKENIITKDMISPGVFLISVGLHKGEDGKLHGDYNEKEIEDVASYYTPTPGGVGPINVAMLLENLIAAAEKTL